MRVAPQKPTFAGTSLQEGFGALRIGVDIVEIERLRGAVERWGERFLRRIYTNEELAYCRRRAPQLAARFAAKEAVMKTLGTGTRGVGWKEIEVYKEPTGAPGVRLHGRAAERAEALGLRQFAISLSHSHDYVVAFVVATQGETT